MKCVLVYFCLCPSSVHWHPLSLLFKAKIVILKLDLKRSSLPFPPPLPSAPPQHARASVLAHES